MWELEYLPEVADDFETLDGSQKILVRKAINKTLINPLPAHEGGYGKPLGNKGNRNLTGLMKIKLKASGLRIVYSLIRKDEKIIVVVIGVRDDGDVYDIAGERAKKYGL